MKVTEKENELGTMQCSCGNLEWRFLNVNSEFMTFVCKHCGKKAKVVQK